MTSPPQPRDPFVDLEDETEKSLHILHQLRDRHRTLLQSVPEAVAVSATGIKPSPRRGGSSGVFKPSALNWAGAEPNVLQELDEICLRATQLVRDVQEDLQLLRATVQKHVEGDTTGDHYVSGDEIARRVEIVHAFERKLQRAQSDAQDMSKAREYRHMQVGETDDAATVRHRPPTSGMSPSAAAAGSPNADSGSGGVNDFASHFVKQEVAEQERIAAQHGQILEQIHVGILSAEDKAKIINEQLKVSNEKLGVMDRHVDVIQGRLDSAVKTTNKLLESTSERNKLIAICILTAILVLLLFGLFSNWGSATAN